MDDHDKRLDLLGNIMRASHFEWRRAVLKLFPDADPTEVVKQYWTEVGRDTAAYYLKRIDPGRNLIEQVASLFVASSVAMGENADVTTEVSGDGCCVRHNECPWYNWHQREGLLHEDQAGCDHWFATVLEEINRALGSSLRFETVQSLPAGDACCLRRLWEDRPRGPAEE